MSNDMELPTKRDIRMLLATQWRYINQCINSKNYQAAANAMKEIPGWQSNAVLNLDLGRMYHLLGQHKQEVALYFQFLSIPHEHLGLKLPSLIESALIEASARAGESRKIAKYFAKQGKWEEAAQTFQQAKRPRLELICLFKVKDKTQSIDLRIRQLKRHIYDQALAKMSTGDYEAALFRLNHIEKIMQFTGYSFVYFHRDKMLCLENLKQYTQAIAFAENFPLNTELQLSLARCYEAVGEYKKALAIFNTKINIIYNDTTNDCTRVLDKMRPKEEAVDSLAMSLAELQLGVPSSSTATFTTQFNAARGGQASASSSVAAHSHAGQDDVRQARYNPR